MIRDLIFVIMLGTFMFVLGTVAYEQAIYRSCLEHGDSGTVMWKGQIKCEPIKINSTTDYSSGRSTYPNDKPTTGTSRG